MAEKEKVNIRLGQEIKKLRKSKGISQKKLAEIIGISFVSMNKIEQGEQRPNNSTLQDICKVLNIPVSFLYFMSIDEDDFVDEEKRDLFVKYRPVLKSMLNELTQES